MLMAPKPAAKALYQIAAALPHRVTKEAETKTAQAERKSKRNVEQQEHEPLLQMQLLSLHMALHMA